MEKKENKINKNVKNKEKQNVKRNNKMVEKKSKIAKDVKDNLNKNKDLDIEFSNIETGLIKIQDNKPVTVNQKTNKPSIFAKSKLKIIPLGGMNEIGKNYKEKKDV